MTVLIYDMKRPPARLERRLRDAARRVGGQYQAARETARLIVPDEACFRAVIAMAGPETRRFIKT